MAVLMPWLPIESGSRAWPACTSVRHLLGIGELSEIEFATGQKFGNRTPVGFAGDSQPARALARW